MRRVLGIAESLNVQIFEDLGGNTTELRRRRVDKFRTDEYTGVQLVQNEAEWPALGFASLPLTFIFELRRSFQLIFSC
jgi:hypothetical protein